MHETEIDKTTILLQAAAQGEPAWAPPVIQMYTRSVMSLGIHAPPEQRHMCIGLAMILRTYEFVKWLFVMMQSYLANCAKHQVETEVHTYDLHLLSGDRQQIWDQDHIYKGTHSIMKMCSWCLPPAS